MIFRGEESGVVYGKMRLTKRDKIDEAESGDLLKRLRSVTRDYTLPDDACATYQLTFQNLEELESDMFRHVHLENNILFPRLMAQLAAL